MLWTQRSNVAAVDVITATVTADAAAAAAASAGADGDCDGGVPPRVRSMEINAVHCEPLWRLMRDTHEFAPVGLAACSSPRILDRTTDDSQLHDESDPISIQSVTFARSLAAWRRRKYYKQARATAAVAATCTAGSWAVTLNCCISYAENVKMSARTMSWFHVTKSTRLLTSHRRSHCS